ncbi:unannotated protein [freshwater metagenome]|uniref:Unannotated protein n=1 Tax=freshwater metagenome TaxID=449393 RepID=A0A6J5ZZN6_9ZZZZ|nr:hypothetical protein [Actinomycetota bacterium]
MNNLPLFIAGFLISLIVIAAIGLLLYAAVLDGRYEQEQQAQRDIDTA